MTATEDEMIAPMTAGSTGQEWQVLSDENPRGSPDRQSFFIF
jgi:hypothetical protein